jgi:hypothetical protein
MSSLYRVTVRTAAGTGRRHERAGGDRPPALSVRAETSTGRCPSAGVAARPGSSGATPPREATEEAFAPSVAAGASIRSTRRDHGRFIRGAGAQACGGAAARAEGPAGRPGPRHVFGLPVRPARRRRGCRDHRYGAGKQRRGRASALSGALGIHMPLRRGSREGSSPHGSGGGSTASPGGQGFTSRPNAGAPTAGPVMPPWPAVICEDGWGRAEGPHPGRGEPVAREHGGERGRCGIGDPSGGSPCVPW